MDFTKFLSLVDGRSLYFPSITTLSKADPYEGAFSESVHRDFLKPFSDVPKEDRASWAAYIHPRKDAYREAQNVRLEVYVSSWHAQAHESAAMWSLYGKGGAGIAIVSTVGDLIAALNPGPNDFYVGDVQYVDYSEDTIMLLDSVPLRPFIHKRIGFEHEKELRVVVRHPDADPVSWDPAVGLSVPVDVTRLVRRVVVAPESPSWVLALVRSVLGRYQWHSPVDQSPLLAVPNGPYDLDIDDPRRD